MENWNTFGDTMLELQLTNGQISLCTIEFRSNKVSKLRTYEVTQKHKS